MKTDLNDFRRFDGYGVASALALRYDGYAILQQILEKRKTHDKTWGEKKIEALFFDIDEWAQRWHLFAYQRAFGKWSYLYGAPIREECAFRLLALHLYRETVPPYFRFVSDNCYFEIPEEILEDAASNIRKEFVPLNSASKESYDSIESSIKYWLDYKTNAFDELMKRPEILLAFSCNRLLLAENMHTEYPDQNWGIMNANNWMSSAYHDLRFQIDDCANWVTMQNIECFLLRRSETLATYKTREHALFMLLYLHLYRQPIPCWARQEPFATQWEKMPKQTKTQIAQRFRRKLSEIYEANASKAKR